MVAQLVKLRDVQSGINDRFNNAKVNENLRGSLRASSPTLIVLRYTTALAGAAQGVQTSCSISVFLMTCARPVTHFDDEKLRRPDRRE
jgi:hypothetical protein